MILCVRGSRGVGGGVGSDEEIGGREMAVIAKTCFMMQSEYPYMGCISMSCIFMLTMQSLQQDMHIRICLLKDNKFDLLCAVNVLIIAPP